MKRRTDASLLALFRLKLRPLDGIVFIRYIDLDRVDLHFFASNKLREATFALGARYVVAVVFEFVSALQANAYRLDHIDFKVGTFAHGAFRKRLEGETKGIFHGFGHNAHGKIDLQNLGGAGVTSRFLDRLYLRKGTAYSD